MTRLLSTLAAVIAVCGAAAAPAAAADAFFEPFDQLDRHSWYVAHDYANGRYQNCMWSKRHASIRDGILNLTLIEREYVNSKGQRRDFVCAEIQTREKLGYGLYETSMRVAEGSGITSTFFTYVDGKSGQDEIDIEALGRAPNQIQTNVFVAGKGDNEQMIPVEGASSRFVHYAFEWLPDSVRWYVDGTLVREVTGDKVPKRAGKLYLSIWGGAAPMSDWLGKFDRGALPATTEIDWVGFTPAGESCAFEQSLSCNPDWVAAATN